MGRPRKHPEISKRGPGRPPAKSATPKKSLLPDLIDGKFAIAREHLDHIQVWTEADKFERLDTGSGAKEFESRDAAEEYIENFRDATPEFSDTALFKAVVVDFSKIYSHRYVIELSEEGKPVVSVELVMRGMGNNWKDAVALGAEPIEQELGEAAKKLKAFVDARNAEQSVLEDAVLAVREKLSDYEKEIKKLG